MSPKPANGIPPAVAAEKAIWYDPAMHGAHLCLLTHDCASTTHLHRCSCGSELYFALRRPAAGSEPKTH